VQAIQWCRIVGAVVVVLAGTGLTPPVRVHALPNVTKESPLVPSPAPAAHLLNQDAVQLALTAFEKSVAPGVWPELDKATILSEIQARVKPSTPTQGPFLVNQGPQPLCGPAAVVFELVRKRPDRYIRYCRDLFETGAFDGDSERVEATTHLLRSRVPKNMSQVDWMLMATLRDSENWFFDVDADGGLIANGISTPWEMKGWADNVLGCHSVEYISTFLWGEEDAIREADQIVASGGVAFLMIHSALVGNDDPFVSYPDHWIGLLGSLSITEDSEDDTDYLQFNIYSWGRKIQVYVDEDRFEDYFFGVVAGRL
jgi:hypothetical protein